MKTPEQQSQANMSSRTNDIEQMKEHAERLAQERNKSGTDFRSGNIYRNFLDGVLIDVTFEDANSKSAINHVYFSNDSPPEVYMEFSQVCRAVADYKERRFFFRFLDFAGISGLIALFLVVVFSILLCILAFWSGKADPSVVEIIKISFTLILGYFFGSQAQKPR